MVDPNTNGDEPRLVLTGGGSGARVVLAEVDAPGSLHYLLEAEGFSVVGCAGDDEELGRVLGQDLRPDVIVLDADIAATSTLVARELAPDAHVIAVWPDDVQSPPGGERVSPRLVYEELGPAIRRHMDRRNVPVPVIALPAEEPALASVETVAGVGFFGRAASRVSVLSATLVTAIALTMGVSFALGGFSASPSAGPPRIGAPGSSDAGVVGSSSDPLTGRVPSGVGNGPSANHPSNNGGSHGPNDHNHASGSLGGVVTTSTGGDTIGGGTDGTTGVQSGGQGDQGTGQGGQGGSQGGQGGSQGGQGGGQGGQGGGQGGQGGGPGDHGGGQGGGQGDGGGQHGGGGQGDQGGDSQGDDDQGGSQGDQDGDEQGQNDQGQNDQGQNDQGQNSQGQNSQGDQGVAARRP